MALNAGVVYADLALGDTDRLTRGITEAATRGAQQFTETFQRNLGGADFYNQADIGRQSSEAGRSAAQAYSTAFQRGVAGIDYADDPSAGRQGAAAGGGAGRAFLVALEAAIKSGNVDFVNNAKAVTQGATAGAESGKAFSAAFKKEANNTGSAASFFNIGGAGLAAFANVMRDTQQVAKKGGDDAGWSWRQSFLARSFVGLSTDASKWFSSTLISNPYVLGTVAAVGTLLGGALSSAIVAAIGLGGIGAAIAGAMSLVGDYNKAKSDLSDATNKQADAAQRWLDAEDRWLRSGGKDIQAAKDKKKADEDQTAAINAQADAKQRLANTPDGIPELIQKAKDLGATFKSVLQDLSKPFIKPFADSLGAIQDAVKRSGAIIKPGMQDLAGAVKPLTEGLTSLTVGLMPSFNRDLQSAATVLKHIGEVDLPKLKEPLSFFFDTIAKVGSSKEGLQALDFVFASLATTLYIVSGILLGFQWSIKLVDWAVQGIVIGAKAVADFFTGPFVQALGATLNALAPIPNAVHAISSGFMDAVAWLIAGWNLAWAYVVNPIRVFFTEWVPNWVSVGRNWIVNLWNDATNWVIAGWHAVENWVINPLRVFFTQWIPDWIATGKAWIIAHWNSAWDWVMAKWHWVVDNVAVPLHNIFYTDIPNAFATAKAWVIAHWNQMWQWVSDKWDWVKTNVIDRIKNIITQDIPNAFHEGTAAVGRWWEDLKGIVAKPINFVIKTVLEDGILGAIRWIASKVGVPFDVHVQPIPGYAQGGQVAGPGSGTSDSILGLNDHGIPTARVSAGEYVVNARSTQRFKPMLDAINSGVPGFALGGLVGDIGGFFSDAAGSIGREVKGLGQTAIDIITDPAKKLVDEAGKLLGGIPGAGFAKDIPVGAAKTAVGWLADWVKNQITGKFSASSADVIGIQNWLRTHVNGLPYTWGAVGPDTFDCSGLVGEVIARVLHMPSYKRYFTTSDEAGFLQSHGFHRGRDGDLIVGFSPTHTMGMIGGLPFEAGSTPIHVGSGTSDVFGFPEVWAMKIANGAAGFGGAAVGGLQEFAKSLLPGFGWGADQFGPLQALWNQESGWNPNAVNPSSGAYGIPQALGQGHPFDLGNGSAQIQWGLRYILGRYGSPAAAWAHEKAFNWYDSGGTLRPGASAVINGTGQPEAVLTNRQWRDISTLAARNGELTVHVVVHDDTVKGLVDAEIEEHDRDLVNQLFRGAGQ